MRLLTGKHIVVTGAARGIGAAIAKACVEEGAKVALVDRLADDLHAQVAQLKADGALVTAHICDLTSPSDVTTLFDSLIQQAGSIDGLVNNAGTTIYGNSQGTSLDELMAVMRVHLAPTLLSTQAVAPHMVAKGAGRIVHMSSAAAQAAVTRLFGYSMAKAAIVAMTQHMASEWGEYGVTVNALAPGPVLTDALRTNQDMNVQAMLKAGIPMSRFASPQEVAGAALFLLSDYASHVNGHVLNVDGGLMALRTPLHKITSSIPQSI